LITSGMGFSGMHRKELSSLRSTGWGDEITGSSAYIF